jgi:4-hydroxy-tetrahydrodipicolinate synthase
VPVYAGVSDTGTKRALNNIREAEDTGADIVVAHPPFYYPPNAQDELYRYFEQIALYSSKPVMLYNIPFTTQAPIALETIKRLFDFDNIIGIKDSSVDYVFLQNLIELKRQRPDFKIFIGKSHMWAAGILSGADGGLDGISNVIPHKCVNLYHKTKQGSDDIFKLQREINEIFRIYECRSFLGGIKTAMSLMGLCNPFTTNPILMASQEEVAKIKRILIEWEVLK